MFFKSVLFLLTISIYASADYLSTRKAILDTEKTLALGGKTILNPKEQQANLILLSIKHSELKKAQEDIDSYPPAHHFFDSIPQIEKSKIFAIIQNLPKGASLHTHLSAAVSSHHIFENYISRDNLHGCKIDGRLKLKFFAKGKPSSKCAWEPIKSLRKDPKFDAFVKSQISLFYKGLPKPQFKNVDHIWKTFIASFSTLYDLIAFKPVFHDFLYEALRELYADKVVYAEFRANFPELYELDGKTHATTDLLKVFAEVVAKFKKDHPKFVGAKLIYSVHRKLSNEDLKEVLDTLRVMQKTNPNELAGFDLVGHEDAGKPLLDFYEQLKSVENVTNFFFHAGETNWYGYEVDNNLIDAILLGTKRIGHGYALLKHPEILALVKEKNVAIEVSPISNQVLRYIDDLRNHPAVPLISQGYPVVVCNDDPGFWGAKGLTYDWYLVYMAMTRKDAGLQFLKELALNSFKYSSLSEGEKTRAVKEWEGEWSKFIDELIKKKGLF